MTTRADLLLLQDVALTLWGPNYNPGKKPMQGVSADELRDFVYRELEQIATHLAAKPNISPIDARFYDARVPSGTAGGDLTGTYPSPTIATGAVTLAKMADLAQDKFIIRTTASTGVPQTATCTAAGRAILDDADAAAQRTTLGLGTAAVAATGDFDAAGVAATAVSNHAAAADPHTGYQKESEKDAVSGYAGLNSASRVTKGVITTDDLIVNLNGKGIVLKDDAGTPHYWRISVSALGVLSTTDIGTSAP